jgi:Sec7 domain
MREQKLDVQEQTRNNSVQSNVDSFFSMAKKVAITPLKPTPNPINVPRPRKFLLQTAVFQVINSNTVKDRYLFLFNDLLFIAKPIMDESIMSGLTSSNSRSMSEDSMGGHSKYSDNHRYRFRPTQDSLFQVKNIVELSKVTLYVTRDYEVEPVLLKSNADGQMVLPPPRKIHPILASALRKFESDPDRAISYLMEKKILTEDPISIANFLFKTADLSRRQLGRYISNPENSNVFHAFLDCFRLQGMRLDEAVRTFLITFRLPSKYESLHYVITTFAKKWHDTNQNVLKFHEDMIVKVIFAMLRLNSAIWHDRDVDQDVFLFAMDRREQKKEKLASGSEQSDNKSGMSQESIPTPAEFLERWSIYDQYNLVPKEFMVEMYDSIREEKMETGWDHKYQPHANTMSNNSTPDVAAQQEQELIISVLPHRLPTRLTKGVPSSKVTIYIPEPDPDLQIKLRGQDLVCQPSVLDFSRSRMQTFTITGSTLGRTSLMFIKSGSRAGRYVSPALPRTKAIVVERSFMRHTFQIGFYHTEVKESLLDPSRRRSSAQSPTQQSKGAGENQDDDRETNISRREIQRTKRKYMFSVETEDSLREWVNQLRNLCGHVNREGHHQISSKDTATKTPEELVSLQVLKEALLADEAKRGIMGLRSMTIDKRASLISTHGGDPLSPPSGSDVGKADDERSKFLSSPNLLSVDSGSKSISAAAAANVVAKRGHEIVKLAVQNSLMPTMLGFLKQSLGKA